MLLERIIIFIVSAIVLILQIILLVFSVKRPNKRRWFFVYALEIVSFTAAVLLMICYDSLPGYGLLPGLTYFQEWFLCLSVAIAYACMVFITIICNIVTVIKLKVQVSHNNQ